MILVLIIYDNKGSGGLGLLLVNPNHYLIPTRFQNMNKVRSLTYCYQGLSIATTELIVTS